MSLARNRITVLGGLVLAAALLGGCAPRARVIPFSSLSAFNALSADRIADYPDALSIIMAVMVNDLKLPRVEMSLMVYRNVPEFQSGLMRELGMDAALAAQMTSFAGGVGAATKVLINEHRLARHAWPERMKLLAHELTHCVQYSLAGGQRGSSDQWLREGFADWVSYQVLEKLGLDTYARRRQMRLEQIRLARLSRSFPTLTQMTSLKEWVTWQNDLGSEATYAQSFLAVEHLIEKNGPAAVVKYFSLFDGQDDRLANFSAAFNESFADFDQEFGRRLRSLLDEPLVSVL